MSVEQKPTRLDGRMKATHLTGLGRDLFTSNVIGTDFDDVQVFKVTGRDFIQQPGGGGVHVSFSVSWHALGKMGAGGHEALEALLPEPDNDD